MPVSQLRSKYEDGGRYRDLSNVATLVPYVKGFGKKLISILFVFVFQSILDKAGLSKATVAGGAERAVGCVQKCSCWQW